MIWMCIATLLGSLNGGEPPAVEALDTDPVRELLPGVFVGEGFIEFPGKVCADPSHPQTPIVYLELLVTGPDSREHESLVVTRVKASAIHAGLLAAGLEPGHPLRSGKDGTAQLATGESVVVMVRLAEEPTGTFERLSSWAIHLDDEIRLSEADGWGLVFSGSKIRDGQYAADQTGTIIGLTGFGTEVISAAWGLSHRAAVDEPVWIVDGDRVPAFGVEVVIRVGRFVAPEETVKPTESDSGAGGD
ncbi:MAG: YdjY domain-containing protein [Phycisphaerales bacterium]